MIEIVSAARCTGCNICVHVCPVNVFDAVEDGIPQIARQADCQTCFMCEAYCPEDALFVAPQADQPVSTDERVLAEKALLGSYRRALGWTPETKHLRSGDLSYQIMGER